MIGDRMMVAPIFVEDSSSAMQGPPRRNADGSRRVVLPEGGWHDFWTGEAIQGGTEISVPASTKKIPVYVKSGSIVPWADVGLYAGAPEARRLTARVYGNGSMPFTLNSDAGALHLTWSNGTGRAEGGSPYDVYAWKQIG
jgi:alpha-glucosidase (family GH31 glycosyl hydrolase)